MSGEEFERVIPSDIAVAAHYAEDTPGKSIEDPDQLAELFNLSESIEDPDQLDWPS